MEYRSEALLFLERSREEIRRLEGEIRRLSEIIVRLETLTDSGERRTPEKEPPNQKERAIPAPSPPVPSPLPVAPPPEKGGDASTGPFRPVGEVAEEILRKQDGPVSLEELYRQMKDRPDMAPSRDLKNAIRVSLIRRKPRILPDRRGWFRYDRGS